MLHVALINPCGIRKLLHLGLPAFDWDDRQMTCAKRTRIAGPTLALAGVMSLAAPARAELAGVRLIVLAQAMIPRTGMMDAQNPMPMKERYLKRFPQPARVGDLIGMPVLDLNSKTLGYVQQVVQTPAGAIEFIVGLVRAAGCRSTGGARHRRRAIGITRYATQRI
jgi:hypothetical protein